ncbi:MAG: class I SAM-dependent methyltransferase [Promethearchaeota archaeon]
MTNKRTTNKEVVINFIRIKKADGQHFIQFIKESFKIGSIIDQKYRIFHEKKSIFFPLVENKTAIKELINKIDKLIFFEIVSRKAAYRSNFKYYSLKEALRGKIPNFALSLIPKSYDIIGKIAIIEFERPFPIRNKEEAVNYKSLIAKAVLDVNKSVQSVFEKKSEIKGPHRLRELVLLSGENISETIHNENNCSFKLNVKNTYFSPRLVFERSRISSNNIKKNELIIDLFSGVGPFSVQIAKLNDVKIHAFDVNPHAYNYLRANIDLNILIGEITPHNMDVKDLILPSNPLGKDLYNSADRIIMNLPELSLNFIGVACFLMKKSGGTLHFYQFSEKPNPIKKTLDLLKKELHKFYWGIVEILSSRVVKSYSPKVELVVVDLKLSHTP